MSIFGTLLHDAVSTARRVEHGVEKGAADAWDNTVHEVKSFVTGRSNADATLHQSVDQLQHNGDQTTLNLSANGKFTGPFLDGAPLGAQGQDGASIAIKQVGGPNAPGSTATTQPPSYQVTLTETQQVGLNSEFDFGTTKVKFGTVGVEVNGSVANSVTVNVKTKADAERIAKTYAAILAANQVQMGADDVLGNGDAEFEKALKFDNPIMDAINGSGGSQNLAQSLALKVEGVNSSDLTFLKSHVSSSSHTLTVSGNAKVGLSPGDILAKTSLVKNNPGLKDVLNLIDVSVKPDESMSLTRTVTNASGVKPATVAYTLGGQVSATYKAGFKIPFGPQGAKGPLKVSGPGPQDQDSMQSSVTASYDLKQGDVDHPEAALAHQRRWDKPDQIQLKSVVQSNPNFDGGAVVAYKGGVVDTDTATVTLDHPTKSGNLRLFADTLRAGASGDSTTALRDEQRLGSDFSTSETTTEANRSASPRLSFDPSIGFGDLKISAGINADITTDTVTSSQTSKYPDIGATTVTPQPQPKPQPPAPPHGQYVVTPRLGVNVRQAPSTSAGKTGDILHGSFVVATGGKRADAQGNTWLQVGGTDMAGRPVRGWVEQRYLAAHPDGALSGTGRIDPAKPPVGYVSHVVAPAETVYSIAAANGVTVSDLEDANGRHIIDPNVIFPGDLIYVPTDARRIA
jgi:LysM domain